jgi:hypothetical protein
MYSSRGPHSAAQIHQYCPFAAIYNNNSKTSIPSAGDAGFLVPYLFPEHVPRDIWPLETKQPAAITNNDTATNSSSRLCIIPHHDERNNPQFRRVEHEYGAIRLTVQQSWQDMATSMLTKCDRVLSSSLHGIIFAEMLGLASKRFRLTQQPGDSSLTTFTPVIAEEDQQQQDKVVVVAMTLAVTVLLLLLNQWSICTPGI